MPTATPDTADPLYLYAIVPLPACDGIESTLDAGLRLIRGTRHAAVVRPAAGMAFAGRSRPDLARLLLAHQQVTETIMAQAPVLPVKFATVAPDRVSVEHCLASGGADFDESFAQLAGKCQFELLASWDPAQVLAQIAGMPEIARLRQDAATPLALGAAVKRLFDRRREEVAEGLATALRTVAADTVDNALMDDRMVLNLALLIDAGQTDTLDDCLEVLDALHDGQLNFRCVGPLPPHSFATVEVSFLDAGQISWARGVLELDESADAAELRSAYHRLAKGLHPDAASGTADGAADGDRMTDLQHAYRTLRALAEASGPVQVSVTRQDLRPNGIAP